MSNDARTPGSDDGRDPLEEMLRQLFGGQGPDPDEVRRAMEGLGGPGGVPFDPSQLNPAMMQQAMAQFQAMMSSGSGSDGPVNWSLAKQAARQAVAGEDPAVGSFARREVDEALRLAELWLDGVTQTEPVGSVGVAWSRAEWVEATMDQWRRLTEPVAVSMSRAMSAAIEQQLPGQLPEGMDASLLGGLQPMLKNMGGTMFGLQLGGAVGALGKEVLSGTDIGLPVAGHRLALVPVNIEEFGDGLSVPDDQIRIYLALREAAAFWEHVTAEHGTEYREEIWRHPERQPTAEDLEDPAGYAGRRSAADASAESLDDELRKLLEGGFGDAPREG